VQDSADTLTLGNNSSFRVSTSVRSGTLNWLHVSEYGKICAQYPDKAREIRTGSFPAAESGTITAESTAEGEGGDFYDISIKAQEMLSTGAELTARIGGSSSYPWWRAKEYRLRDPTWPSRPMTRQYFERIANDIQGGPFLASTSTASTRNRRTGGSRRKRHSAPT
jgi:hypothetical protein